MEGRVLDVRDGDAIASLADELAEVDIVFSNAASRMSPDVDLPSRSTPPPRPTTGVRRRWALDEWLNHVHGRFRLDAVA